MLGPLFENTRVCVRGPPRAGATGGIYKVRIDGKSCGKRNGGWGASHNALQAWMMSSVTNRLGSSSRPMEFQMPEPKSAAWFWSTVVIPTVDEYRSSPDDVRKALLSAVVVIHAIEHAMHDRFEDPDEADIAAKRFRSVNHSIHFEAVRELADAAKHGRLQSGKRFKGFNVGHGRSRPPGIWGKAVWAESLWNDIEGGVSIEWKDGQIIQFDQALTNTMDLLRSEFPELLMDRSQANP